MTPVTKQEHELMLTLFGVQFQYIAAMAEALNSAGLMFPHDVGAFLGLAKTQQPAQAFAKSYFELASQLGVEIPA
jgi:hypothetical protein